MAETPLPPQTQQAYDELASEANSPEEQQALDEMIAGDKAERAEAIQGIASQPMPEVDPNGVAAATSEEAQALHEPNQEYGQGGPRA